MKLPEWEKSQKDLKDFNLAIGKGLGKMVKKCGRARFYLSWNYSCTLYFLAKILLVRLRKLHTSACMNLDYGTAKQYPKMVRFIKTGDQYPHKFNFGHFFSSPVKM